MYYERLEVVDDVLDIVREEMIEYAKLHYFMMRILKNTYLKSFLKLKMNS